MKKYLNIKTIGIGILAVLIICLFLSKTIYSFNMPQVTATIPFSGKLSKTETASGIASWTEKEDVYIEISGKVEEVFVNEGDYVTVGQEILRLSFDYDDTKKKIEELNISRSKIELDIENIDLKIKKVESDIMAAQTERTREVKKAEENYECTNSLYQIGGITRSELESAEQNVQSTIEKYEKQIVELQNQIVGYNQDIKAKQLDLRNNSVQLKPYQDILSTNGRIIAPVDGTIGGLEASRGAILLANQTICAIGIGDEFTVNATLPLENSFVAVGDTCRLTNSTHSFNGTVSRVTPNEKNKTIQITVADANISPSETFSITFKKEGERTEKLVPNAAIQQDSNGYFLYKIKRRKGVLGDEYYTEKLTIYIGDSDNENTVILNDIGFFEPVVLSSSKSFDVGDTISLKNGGDFFAKD